MAAQVVDCVTPEGAHLTMMRNGPLLYSMPYATICSSPIWEAWEFSWWVYSTISEHLQCMRGLPLWLSWERIHQQCERPGFDPWVGKIPWRRERLPVPVFWSGEFHGLYSPWGCKESDMTERLSLHFHRLWDTVLGSRDTRVFWNVLAFCKRFK